MRRLPQCRQGRRRTSSARTCGACSASRSARAQGFAFSDALAKKGGTWNWDNLSQWLTSPKKFAPGTKMTFAGLGNPQDRANVIAFLNQHSDAPQAAAGRARRQRPARRQAASRAGPNNGPQKAEKEPVPPAQAGHATADERRRRRQPARAKP